MKVTCSQCLAVYNIPENKLKKDVSRTTCRKCGNRIEIRKPVGIPSLKPIIEEKEELSAPHPLHDILDHAKPKRILDDERTILDEARSEHPRPAVMTNIAFGPNPAAKKFLEEDTSGFQSFPADTMPSIHMLSEEENDPPTEERHYPQAVVEEESEEQSKEEEDGDFRLDLVMAFCADILALVGVVLMVFFSGEQRFFGACMVSIFGIVCSLMLKVSSRFGVREGNLIVSILSAIIAILIFNVVYTTISPVM